MGASSLRMRRLRATLPLLLELAMVGGYFFLDVRDLYYKTAYIGPTNSFAFYAVSSRELQTKPLVPTTTLTAIDPSLEVVSSAHRGSGWATLLTQCDKLQPASPFFFIGAMGVNCRVGVGANATIVPQLYLSSSVRADSMAWAACQILYRHRKPRLCDDEIVTGFTGRYGFDDVEVGSNQLALPASDAEAELLALLDVIAKSEPISLATCVEAFEFKGEGFYTTHIYGCAAPNVMASALVGIHATAFRELHQDKAWLTVDTINLMGAKYILRQNVKSEFPATVNAQTGAVSLTPKTVTNFSSSGGLYCVMIVIDIVLMVLNLWSGVEISRLMILPLLQAHWTRDNDPAALRGVVENYRAVLTCPLYRSRPIVLLTVATQLISWVIILPNSIIFTWSTSSQVAKIQAYLSSLRLWTLLLLSFNAIWDAVVFCNERLAYAISRRTYVAVYEIIIIGALVSYVKRLELFAVTGVKYTAEHQRYTDTKSFVGTKAFGNSYNPQLDRVMNTPVESLWKLYRLLAELLLWGLLAIVLVLVTRFLALSAWDRYQQWRSKRRTGAVANTKVQVETSEATEVKAFSGTEGNGVDDPLFTKRGSKVAEDIRAPAVVPSAQEEMTTTNITRSDDTPYRRLPLEQLLNIPIRALCLVRTGLDMETTTETKSSFIRTPYMLEHGVVLDGGQLRVRNGFFSNLQPEIDLGRYIPPKISDALSLVHERRQRKTLLQKAQ